MYVPLASQIPFPIIVCFRYILWSIIHVDPNLVPFEIVVYFWSILWPIINPILVIFGQILDFFGFSFSQSPEKRLTLLKRWPHYSQLSRKTIQQDIPSSPPSPQECPPPPHPKIFTSLERILQVQWIKIIFFKKQFTQDFLLPIWTSTSLYTVLHSQFAFEVHVFVPGHVAKEIRIFLVQSVRLVSKRLCWLKNLGEGV